MVAYKCPNLFSLNLENVVLLIDDGSNVEASNQIELKKYYSLTTGEILVHLEVVKACFETESLLYGHSPQKFFISSLFSSALWAGTNFSSYWCL